MPACTVGCQKYVKYGTWEAEDMQTFLENFEPTTLD